MKPTKKFLTASVAAAVLCGASAVLCGASAVLCGASAYAADLPVKAPYFKAPVSLYDWTGFYVGANAGVGVSQSHTSTLSDVPLFFGDTGFVGGVQAGYNWQFAPQWVVGLEGDIGFLGIKRGQFTTNVFAEGVKTDWYSTIRGRLGYTNGPSLFYATGGAAFVKVKNNQDNALNLLVSKSETATGWTVGGGIETLLGGNWSAKAEYLYIDAGSQDVFNPNEDGLVHFDNRFHVYRYGLNYKFGAPVASGPLPVHNWTGLYVGVNAGEGLAQTQLTISDNGAQTDIANSSFAGGLQVGYNWQFAPTWVAGFEGDIGLLAINKSEEIGRSSPGVKTNWYSTLRGRLGYTTGPALLYVTGGAAFVKVKNSFDESIAAIFASKSETASGWTLGGGIEAALAPNWTAKTEYLYIDAGSQDVTNPDFTRHGTGHFDNRFHVFRAGLNYAFGGY